MVIECEIRNINIWHPDPVEIERSQNTVSVASTQAVYKALHSTVRETDTRHTHPAHAHSVEGSLRV